MKKSRTCRFIALLLVISLSIELSDFSTHAQEYDIETEERIEIETSVEEYDIETEERIEIETSVEEQEKTEMVEISEEVEEMSEESIQLDSVGQSDEEKQINEVEQIPDINEVKDDIDSKIEENPTMQSNSIWNGDKNTVWEGKGTSDNPYLIKSAEDLAGISYQSRNDNKTFDGVYFKLINDIYLNDVTNFEKWEDDTSVLNTWQSIKSFGGIFLGENHTIYGMFCNSTSDDGLFQRCWGNVLIKDLHIDKSLVINTGSNRVGGIIGWIRCAPSTSIQNCSFSGNIKCGSGAYAGGIVGYATSPANTNQVTIKGCKNYANISGGKSIGGMVGYADQDFHETIISNCTNYGEICGGG